MKKVIAFILAVSVLAGSVHLDEFVRIPKLIQHYTDHKNLQPSVSFIQFLYAHYFLKPVTYFQHDQKNHSKLPFKSAKSFQQHFSPYNELPSSSILIFRQFRKLDFPDAGIAIVHVFSSIWQPPKIVPVF